MNMVRCRRHSSTVTMPARAKRNTCCSAAPVDHFRNTPTTHTALKQTHHHHDNQKEASQSCHMKMEWEREDGKFNGIGRKKRTRERGRGSRSQDKSIIIMIERDAKNHKDHLISHTHAVLVVSKIETTSCNYRARREKCPFKTVRSITGWDSGAAGSHKGS